MSRTSIVAIAAAWLLLTGCGDTSVQEPEAESAPVTERGPVSPDGVSLVSPTELGVDVPSCMGDQIVGDLEEDDEHVRIRIVTTMVVSGDVAACQDEVQVALQQPLGDREVVDLESGETFTVVERNADPDSLAGRCPMMYLDIAEDEPGLDTAEEAIEEFVAYERGLLAEATFEGQEIIYEGEVVGEVSVDPMPAGGYRVTSAEWCYPDSYQADTIG